MTDADRRGLLQALDAAASAAPPPGNFSGIGGFHNGTSGGVGGGTGGGFNATLLNNWTEAAGAAAAANASASSTSPHLPEEHHYWMLVMLLVPALTIFGNVLVVLAVSRERSLQSATNYFIVSLAFADILVASIVMPVSVVVEVQNGHWDYSTLVCDLWIMCDALFSTASILNLVAISIDRFIAVTQPIKYSKHKNSKRTHFTIAVTWLLSIAIALPIGCGLQNMQGLRFRQEFRHVCTFFNGDFLIYSSLGSFYIPCIVMLVLYYRIFTVIRGRARKARRAKKMRLFPNQQQQQQQQMQQMQPQLKHSNENHVAARRPQTLATTPASEESCLACQADGVYTGEQQQQPVPNHTCSGGPSQPLPPQPPQPSIESPQQLTESQTLAGPSNSDNSAAQSDGGGGSSGSGGDHQQQQQQEQEQQQQQQEQHQRKQQLFQQLKLRKKSTNKAERSVARREKKATKTLAIVLGVFLFCWVPFFITNLMWAACLKNFDNQEALGPICQYDRRINVFIVWLGYVNSFLNPLIYTIFNTEFRKAFKKLLHIA